MIPINELRIHNLVWDEQKNPGLIIRIASDEIGSEVVLKPLNVAFDKTTYKVTNHHSIHPIPVLSALSISALGFQQPIFEANWKLNINNNIQMVLIPNRSDVVYLKVNSLKECIPFPINGTHSIQNIFYTMSGEDLQVYLR